MKTHFKPTISPIAFKGSNNQKKPSKFFNQYKKEYTTPWHVNLQKSVEIYLQKNKDISKADIKGFAGHGGLTTVFDLGDKGILKCSKENPLEYRKHNPEFDIPFTSPVVKVRDFYIVRQPKAKTSSVTPKDCIDVIERMSKEGFEPSVDFSKDKTKQVGFYNGKAYLLDTRCAMPKPDKFSIEVYDFCQRNKRVYYANKKNVEDFSHVDETPRANLSVKEARKMIGKIIKDNVKASFPPLDDGLCGLLKLVLKCIKHKTLGC